MNRYQHELFVSKGAQFISRCQVKGLVMYELFKQPIVVTAATQEHKLDAELYAVSPVCLSWVDEQMGFPFDRMVVLAHKFETSAPKEPHLPKDIIGMEAAWMHIFPRPMKGRGAIIDYIYSFPNYEIDRYQVSF